MNLAAIRFRNTEDHIYPRGRNELTVSLITGKYRSSLNRVIIS